MGSHRDHDGGTEARDIATPLAGGQAAWSAPGLDVASQIGNHAFSQVVTGAGSAGIARSAPGAAGAPREGRAAAPGRSGRLVLARRGQPIPVGAIPKATATNSVDGTKVSEKLASMGASLWRDFEGFRGTPLERQAINAFETANLQPRSVAINWIDERGVNKVWTGTVNIRMENPTPVGKEGSGKSTGSGGGSGTTGTSTSTTNTTGASGEVGGEVGGHEGSAKGSAKVGGSTSSATAQGEGQGASGSGGTGSETYDKLQRYECTIVADIFLRLEFDLAGTDYINPFKWGMYMVEAAKSPISATDSVEVGKWTYEVSTGFDPAGPPKG